MRKLLWIPLLVYPLLALAFMRSPGGALPKHTGAPIDGGKTCAFCHGSRSGSGTFSVTAPGEYEPGDTLEINISMDEVGTDKQGFELTVVDASGNQYAGTLLLNDSSTEFAGGNTNYVTHSTPGQAWTVRWKAPDSDEGPVTIYAAGASAPGNPVYTTNLVITPTVIVTPIELTSFAPTIDGGDVILRWVTASETGNAGFEIQRATRKAPGEEHLLETGSPLPMWEVIGFVEGGGTTAAPRQYRFRIEALEPGQHVFRLRQVDLDGSFSFSPEVEVTIEVPRELTLTPNYPNPFNVSTEIVFTVPSEGRAVLEVYNVLGQVVATLFDDVAHPGAQYRSTLSADNLATGTYVYSLRHEGQKRSRTVTLVK